VEDGRGLGVPTLRAPPPGSVWRPTGDLPIVQHGPDKTSVWQADRSVADLTPPRSLRPGNVGDVALKGCCRLREFLSTAPPYTVDNDINLWITRILVRSRVYDRIKQESACALSLSPGYWFEEM
jgi:hypothetical protein